MTQKIIRICLRKKAKKEIKRGEYRESNLFTSHLSIVLSVTKPWYDVLL